MSKDFEDRRTVKKNRRQTDMSEDINKRVNNWLKGIGMLISVGVIILGWIASDINKIKDIVYDTRTVTSVNTKRIERNEKEIIALKDDVDKTNDSLGNHKVNDMQYRNKMR